MLFHHAWSRGRVTLPTPPFPNSAPRPPLALLPPSPCGTAQAPFELRIMSSVPVELVPLPEVKSTVLHGEWTDAKSGGCDLNPMFKKVWGP